VECVSTMAYSRGNKKETEAPREKVQGPSPSQQASKEVPALKKSPQGKSRGNGNAPETTQFLLTKNLSPCNLGGHVALSGVPKVRNWGKKNGRRGGGQTAYPPPQKKKKKKKENTHQNSPVGRRKEASPGDPNFGNRKKAV